jgi:hypothetical protein
MPCTKCRPYNGGNCKLRNPGYPLMEIAYGVHCEDIRLPYWKGIDGHVEEATGSEETFE